MSTTDTADIQTPPSALERVASDLAARFRASAPQRQRPDLMFVTVPREEAVAAVTHLKEFHGFTHLVYFTAIDLIERGLFRLCYMLHSYDERVDLCLGADIPRDVPVADSIHHLWAAASTYERELREMFGIDFPGCPRVNDEFALEGWDELPPMRRDFDTRAYSERTFFPRPGRQKHDRAAIMKRELYPEVDL